MSSLTIAETDLVIGRAGAGARTGAVGAGAAWTGAAAVAGGGADRAAQSLGPRAHRRAQGQGHSRDGRCDHSAPRPLARDGTRAHHG